MSLVQMRLLRCSSRYQVKQKWRKKTAVQNMVLNGLLTTAIIIYSLLPLQVCRIPGSPAEYPSTWPCQPSFLCGHQKHVVPSSHHTHRKERQVASLDRNASHCIARLSAWLLAIFLSIPTFFLQDKTDSCQVCV
jgi:hypothetical protein